MLRVRSTVLLGAAAAAPGCWCWRKAEVDTGDEVPTPLVTNNYNAAHDKWHLNIFVLMRIMRLPWTGYVINICHQADDEWFSINYGDEQPATGQATSARKCLSCSNSRNWSDAGPGPGLTLPRAITGHTPRPRYCPLACLTQCWLWGSSYWGPPMIQSVSVGSLRRIPGLDIWYWYIYNLSLVMPRNKLRILKNCIRRDLAWYKQKIWSVNNEDAWLLLTPSGDKQSLLLLWKMSRYLYLVR